MLIYRVCEEGHGSGARIRAGGPYGPYAALHDPGWVVWFFQVGYYVFVPYMLWMIWQKVRHLPS
jgi:hypothetical protein